MAEMDEENVLERLHKTRHDILSRFDGELSCYLDYLSAHPVPGVRYVNPRMDKHFPVGNMALDSELPLCACEEPAEYKAGAPSDSLDAVTPPHTPGLSRSVP